MKQNASLVTANKPIRAFQFFVLSVMTSVCGQAPPGHVNVQDFIGKDGRSAFDHTDSIQAAIDATAKAGGGAVFFAPGLYRVSAPLRLPRHVVVHLVGSGRRRLQHPL